MLWCWSTNGKNRLAKNEKKSEYWSKYNQIVWHNGHVDGDGDDYDTDNGNKQYSSIL